MWRTCECVSQGVVRLFTSLFMEQGEGVSPPPHICFLLHNLLCTSVLLSAEPLLCRSWTLRTFCLVSSLAEKLFFLLWWTSFNKNIYSTQSFFLCAFSCCTKQYRDNHSVRIRHSGCNFLFISESILWSSIIKPSKPMQCSQRRKKCLRFTFLRCG